MNKICVGLVAALCLWGCMPNKNPKPKIKLYKSYTLQLEQTPVYQLSYFATDSNSFLMGDEKSQNLLIYNLSDTGVTVKHKLKMSADDWLQNVAISGANYYLLYNDSIVSEQGSSPVVRPDSLYYYRINVMFSSYVHDSVIYLENNCKPCLEDPLYCATYWPQSCIDLRTGIVKKMPIEIKINDLGGPYMKADLFAFSTFANNKHYYSFANSDKIFTYSAGEGLVYKSVRSKFQTEDFFQCAVEDTSDYIAYLLQNEICSPLYSSLVYNNKKRLFFRQFSKEQPLFKADNTTNDLSNRKRYIQIMNEHLDLVNEVEINERLFGYHMLTYGDKLVFVKIIINEHGKPVLQLNSYTID